MNFNNTFKKIICLLLALVMVLAVAGCKQEAKKKKKKVIKKQVVVVKKDNDDDDNVDSSIVDSSNDKSDESDSDDECDSESTDDESEWDDYEDIEEESDDTEIEDDSNDESDNTVPDDDSDIEYPDYTPTTKPSRTIPQIPEPKKEKYVEPFTPEFESKNVAWVGPNDYTIVYDADLPANRVLADKLTVFFKDNDKIILEAKPDNDPSLNKDTKMILVGDTFWKTSSLKNTEFAVTLLENGNLFFEGGHNTMVEKAVDWFRTVDRVDGKVAVLTGKQDDFVTNVNLFGKDYVYVWGDEFDGEEFMDTSKWSQMARNEYTDLKIVYNDPHFQYVENGKLRISVDRYFDPVDGNVGWGAHGSYNSCADMIFKNGYLEMKVRIDYGQGSFPALWLMTIDSPLEKYVPNYEQYKNRYFNLETDIFEFFGKGTHAAVNMHKWYNQSLACEELDEDGNGTGSYRFFGVNGVELTDYIKNPAWRNAAHSQGRYSSFVWAWPNNPNQFHFSDEETKTLYKDYHLYQMLYDGKTVKVGIDNNWYCEWPLDVNYDYIEGTDPTNNNNGIGYDFWHYLYLDQYVYPPSRIGEKDADAVITIDSAPLNSYVDYVRLYQLPDDIAVITSAEHGVE